MELEKSVELGILLDVYGNLLTERMQDILKMYVYENLSLQEIANVFKISKPAVLDAIRTSSKKLEYFEKNIKMLKLKKSLDCLIETNSVSRENLLNLLENF